MPPRIVQPTKEQVRAYMHARGRARKPPPPPAEIRRQLGWRIEPRKDSKKQPEYTQISLVEIYLIPTEYSHALLRLIFHYWTLRTVQVCTFRGRSH